jgi:Uma2 family endonuclease
MRAEDAMSTVASKTTFTPDDLIHLPDEGVGYELVDGQLVKRNVSKESSRIAAQIVRLLGSEAAKTKDAEVYGSDLGYQCFPDDRNRIRKPDASLVRKERLQSIERDPGFMPIPADLAVEVISPNDTWYAVSRKVEQYLSADFRLVWLVDPNTRVVVIHRVDGSVSKLHEGDEITGEVALPTFRCRVSEFFTA